MIEVVTFTSTLTDAGENGQAAVLLGDIVDELEHVHGLTDTGTTEKTNLAALRERHEQVDDLDTRDEKIPPTCLLVVRRSRTVDRPLFFGGNGAAVVLRRTEHVHDAAERRLADRNGNGRVGGLDLETTLEAFRGAHRDRSDDAVTELLLNLESEVHFLELQRFVDLRDRFARKLHVDDRADDLGNLAGCHVDILCLDALNSLKLNRCCAADDLSEFLGDRRLTRLVVHELQIADEFACVVRGCFHRDHSCGHLASYALHRRAIDL
ncbi:MAG: hypothetical protein RL597_1477 [Pseudomonadota bacterium]